MKNITLSTILLFLFWTGPLLASEISILRIVDPQSWRIEDGKISEMTLAVEPQGVYMKYDLYMTFSMDHLHVGSTDSMEAVFIFDLPSEAIVCDSWLWIEDYISYGILMDADSASKIYEDIVSRRTDPSILFKRSETRHELRIFPITKEDPRKVKITFLLPMEWTPKRVLADLPLKHFAPWLSKPKIDLVVKNHGSWQNPLIMEEPDNAFTSTTDSLHGDHFRTEINPEQGYNLTLGLDSPMDDGVYVAYDPTHLSEGYYQMALLPAEQIDSLPPTKTLFLLDYEANNGSDFRPLIKEIVNDFLSTKDSFNIMIKTPVNIISASPNWLPADPALLDSLFDPNTFDISDNSSLLTLLATGLQYMTAHNNEGSIVLYSNNDGYLQSQAAEDFYGSLTVGSSIQVPIHIANYQFKHIPEQWDPILRGMLRGNQYLFGILADRSGGSYISIDEKKASLYQIIQSPVIQAQGSFDLIDLYTHTSGGICYDRHLITPPNDIQPVSATILQTGRYYGDLPFSIDFFFLHGPRFEFVDVDIDQSKMDFVGENVRKGWAGKEIQSKSGYYISSEIRKEVVDISIEKKVLSYYTAFLCLEDSVQNGVFSRFQGAPVGIETLEEETLTNLKAFPNPFENEIQITIEQLPIASLSTTQLQLRDIQGKVIHDFELKKQQIFEGKIILHWNGSDLPSGMYLLTMNGPTANHTIKLMKQ